MNFLVNNQENFQTNSSVHSINTRNKHHLYQPTANLPCFQKSAFYTGIRIFNNLLRSLTNLKKEKAQFKIANFLNILLHGVLGRAPGIILMIFFCKVNIFLMLEEFPQKIIPCIAIE
jgi:hypothetical protein